MPLRTPTAVVRLLAAVRRGLRTVLDKVPPTPLGLLASGAAAVAVLYYGRKRQDLVLYVAGLGVAALVAIALLVVPLVTVILWLAWRRGTAPTGLGTRRSLATVAAVDQKAPVERIEAGSPSHTGFSLPALSWLPLVSIRWSWLDPDGVLVENRLERGRLVEEATYRERGEHRRIVRRLLVEDAFGLMRLGLRLVEERPRVVVPARGRPLTAPLIQALAGGDNVSHPLGPPDGDLIEMRRYAPGDPMKRILWKAYARSRTLMVRLPERAVAPTRRTLAYLVTGDEDEAPAGVARMALETQAFGVDWRFGADGAREHARLVDDALGMIVRSRAARPEQGAGLGPFLERSRDFGASRCILFVPARPGPWLEHVEREVKRRPAGCEAVVGTDGVEEEAPRARWRELLLVPDRDPVYATTRASELEAVVRRLAGAGAKVTVIDRRTGRPVPLPHGTRSRAGSGKRAA